MLNYYGQTSYTALISDAIAAIRAMINQNQNKYGIHVELNCQKLAHKCTGLNNIVRAFCVKLHAGSADIFGISRQSWVNKSLDELGDEMQILVSLSLYLNLVE